MIYKSSKWFDRNSGQYRTHDQLEQEYSEYKKSFMKAKDVLTKGKSHKELTLATNIWISIYRFDCLDFEEWFLSTGYILLEYQK